MRIIEIVKKIRTLCLIIIGLVLSNGCSNDLDRIQGFYQKSQVYYQKAVAKYKELIARGKDLDRLYFELGLLYYRNRDFPSAIEVLKKSSDERALKFLAICYYLNGDFTDALEFFQKISLLDDESLYYYGLTCERLNLFDDALGVYKKIKEESFKTKAEKRIYLIERQTHSLNIKEISPRVYEILKNAPSSQDYPQAGALVLYCDEKIQVTHQRTEISNFHYIIKILNERGKKDFAEVHIDYDSTYEKIELEYARTIKPDGTVVEVGSRHLRDVTRYLNFPLYSNVRVFIISFPEITEGVVIEYKLKIYRNQLINKKDFVISYSLQSGEPIIHAEFTVSIPKDNPLNIKFINEEYNHFKAELRPKIREEKDYLIYYWQFKDIPQIIPESNMPSYTEINPTILLSSFDHWQEVYNWWWNLTKDKISADKAIKQKIEELTKDLVDEEEKAKAIYNFCAQQIRYVAVEYGQAGYEPHSAQDIFKNKYGDCKDQAILLVAMLRQIGIPSWPVLIGTKDYYNLNEDFPGLFFNHCIVQAQVKNKLIFLDPTCQTCSFGDLPIDDQARRVLVIKDEGYQIDNIPLSEAEHNLIKQELKIKVNPE
ncbi:MAG: DUF3857 domain-containing protein, partial [Candidatus Omnitrophica bacterium]|nr:DUF3857 domain-containing protein [Candidatus Omnitrophota bacterium]